MWLTAEFIGRGPNDQRKLNILGISRQGISRKVSEDGNMAVDEGIGGGPDRTSIDRTPREGPMMDGVGMSIVTGPRVF